MKKLLSAVLCAVLVLSLAACGKTTPPAEDVQPESVEETAEPKLVLKGHLTEMPCYALPEDATADDMRQMAIRTMRDELSVQWYPESYFLYRKDGPSSDKDYIFTPEKIYCGLPYTNGDSSLLHWLQYYDFESGRFANESVSNMPRQLGNACSTSVMWGWNAVCPDIMWDSGLNMTPQNGCIPVEGYHYPEKIKDYDEIGTEDVVAANTPQEMYTAYANALPADALVQYNKGNHVMMITAPAHVEYRENGEIDPEKSYVTIQDQRSGSTQEIDKYYKNEDGEMHQYSGRIDVTMNFFELLEGTFIPLTCAEFLGEKPYEKATAALESDVATYDELTKAVLRSNYNVISIKTYVTDEGTGDQLGYFNYVRVNNWYNKTPNKVADKEYALTYDFNTKRDSFIRDKALVGQLTKGESYRFKIDVLVATGETFTVLDKVLAY